jgi:hypothetical protein
MVPEEQHRAGIVDRLPGADQLLEEDGRHRRHVLMAEPDVGEDEALVAGLHGRHADPALRGVHHPAAGEDLLAQGHRAGPRGGR